jgi:hypothetical protein
VRGDDVISRYPDDLPPVLAIAAGSLFAAMGFASVGAEEAWGRPSSTAGIAYLFIPVFSVLVALGGFLFGLLGRWLLSSGGVVSRKGPLVSLTYFSVIAAGISGGATHGIRAVAEAEESAKPRILATSPEVERISPVSSTPHVTSTATVLFGLESAAPPPRIALPGDVGSLELAGLTASFSFPSHATEEVSLVPLDYVTRVDAVAVNTPGSGRWTVVAITGRATGRRLIVVTLSADGGVRHAELMQRCWSIDRSPLEAWSWQDQNAGSMAVVPLACSGSVGFRVRAGSPTSGCS